MLQAFQKFGSFIPFLKRLHCHSEPFPASPEHTCLPGALNGINAHLHREEVALEHLRVLAQEGSLNTRYSVLVALREAGAWGLGLWPRRIACLGAAEPDRWGTFLFTILVYSFGVELARSLRRRRMPRRHRAPCGLPGSTGHEVPLAGRWACVACAGRVLPAGDNHSATRLGGDCRTGR